MRLTDFLSKANAARTVNATLGIEGHTWAKLYSFGTVDLLNFKPTAFRSVFIGLDLQRTLAGLITNRAVQRVIDQEKLHRILLSTLSFLRRFLGLDDHSIL